jgi:hypothetical protein
MAYEHKPGSGTLFKNAKKTATNHPDYTGTYKDHNGREFEVAAWIKSGKKGDFLSFATKPKEVKQTVNIDDDPFK